MHNACEIPNDLKKAILYLKTDKLFELNQLFFQKSLGNTFKTAKKLNLIKYKKKKKPN